MTLEMLESVTNDKSSYSSEAMLVAEAMQKCYYRWFIEAEYIKFTNGSDARVILREISDELKARTYNRLCVTVGNSIEKFLTK